MAMTARERSDRIRGLMPPPGKTKTDRSVEAPVELLDPAAHPRIRIAATAHAEESARASGVRLPGVC
jgi:hypothetical protein